MMSLLLAIRNLLLRPRRTAMLLLGYALGVAAMVVLLSVGEAVLRQARDADRIGGGDLVLLPQGIEPEVIKAGGATAMYFRIPQGRYLLRQVLAGYREDVATASPQVLNRVLYLRTRSGLRRILASGALPDHERDLGVALPRAWKNSASDDEWLNPSPAQLYSELDHFHPDTSHSPGWGEWHYFNFVDTLQGLYGYISFLTGGDLSQGQGKGVVSLQVKRRGLPPERYTMLIPGSEVVISDQTPDLKIGASKVSFKDSLYQLSLSLPQAKGELFFHPTLRMYSPPLEVSRPGFRSGYVVPALSGEFNGELSTPRGVLHLNHALGYHDHNWGTWAGVHWDWGQAGDGITALVFGAVKTPALESQGGGYFCVVADTSGFLSLIRPDTVLYEGWKNQDGVLMPGRIRFEKKNPNGDSLTVAVDVQEAIATDLGSFGPGQGGSRFLQMRGTYSVKGRVHGREVSFKAPGSAETFLLGKDAKRP
jgi:hypothetical protein